MDPVDPHVHEVNAGQVPPGKGPLLGLRRGTESPCVIKKIRKNARGTADMLGRFGQAVWVAVDADPVDMSDGDDGTGRPLREERVADTWEIGLPPGLASTF
jgi:hypothetical protein